MTRPTHVHIDTTALVHNVRRVGDYARGKKICAMVKANAYGCDMRAVVPVLEAHVDAFGVACLEEAQALRALGSRCDCLLFQGIFSADELHLVAALRLQCVVHELRQLQWICNTPLTSRIKVWIKVNTGMNRLGFKPEDVSSVIEALRACDWVDDDIGLMTHLACADEPHRDRNQMQLQCFGELSHQFDTLTSSVANSAAIIALPEAHADWVRPGIMLYGVSPFATQSARDLNLMPVMRFMSAVSAIHHYPAGSTIGYGATWSSVKPSIIGVVAAGYGDGYPRSIASNTCVWVNGEAVPIVGRVSMDTLTIDLTNQPNARVGDCVELWGAHMPIETVAHAAGTIAYELLCKVAPRVR